MLKYDVYEDIAKRTNGDIYIGVVGPVRTGKSTFIKRFMELLVLPNLAESNKKSIIIDSLPQSGSGKTVMTTEPKFVPGEAVSVKLKDKATAKICMVDCVGYVTDGAVGFTEDELPRMVKTPWQEELLPFEQAADIGTGKVIRDHATIGVLMTTDGSITDISRVGYISAEERVAKELTEIGKPFIVVLNSTHPDDVETVKLAQGLSSKYNVTVMPLNVEKATDEELTSVIEKVLFEFNLNSFDIKLPKWMQVLNEKSNIISEVISTVKEYAPKIKKIRDLNILDNMFAESEKMQNPVSVNYFLGEGRAEIELQAKDGVFYDILSEECGENIKDDYRLMSYVKKLSEAKVVFDKVKDAFFKAEEQGYGMVIPTENEFTLLNPELTKHGGRYGVKLKSVAPSYHIIRVDVSGEINPTVGSLEQSEDVVKNMQSDLETKPENLWQTNLFGKTVKEMIKEELMNKMDKMPENVQRKMRKTVTRIVNEGRGGILCILL